MGTFVRVHLIHLRGPQGEVSVAGRGSEQRIGRLLSRDGLRRWFARCSCDLIVSQNEFASQQIADDVLIADRDGHAVALIGRDAQVRHDAFDFRIDDSNDVAAR